MAEVEEIFSTPDEPLPVGIVAVHGKNDSSNDVVGDETGSVIETKHLKPSDAFQVFAGRAYHTTGFRSTNTEKKKDPISRYLKLKAELEELERDVAILNKSSENSDNDESSSSTSSGRTVNEIWNFLSLEINNLNSKLHQISETPSLKPLIKVSEGEGDMEHNVTISNDNMDELLNAVSELKASSTTTKPNIDDASTDSRENIPQTDGKKSAVYELYYNGDDDSNARMSRLAALESRLSSMEATMGNPPSSSLGQLFKQDDGPTSIQTAILKLERRVARLDPKLISEAQIKLKPLQKALDQIVSEQSKPSKPSTDSEAIQKLFMRTQVIDDFGGELPALVSRLRSLHSLHEHAVLSVNRMGDIQSKQSEMSKFLSSDREALTVLSNGVEKNMDSILDNIKAVQEKLNN